MKPTEEVILTHAQEANHNAERAYWWMKGIDREEAQRLGVADMVQSVQSVLSLLQKVDNITIDIQITIKQKSI